MCLENPTTKEPLITEKNIEVYKVGYRIDEYSFLNEYYMDNHHCFYGRGVETRFVSLNIAFDKYYETDSINEGYHSFPDKDTAINYLTNFANPETQIGLFLIRAGVKYFKGSINSEPFRYDCLVSETIIFKGWVK